MKIYTALLLIILLSISCSSLIKKINLTNNSTIWQQPAGKNYKWWSTQSERELHEWSVRNDTNILWKTPLDESGQSGIIKVNNRLYFSIMKPVLKKGTTTGTDIIALCYNAETGKKIWERKIAGNLKSFYMYGFSNSSSPTPVSDSKKVWFINASGRIVCFDLNGQKIWERQWHPIAKLGKVKFPFNKQYEPILYGDTLINVEPIYKSDNEGRKANWHYLIALDKNTGIVKWKSTESIGHYNTPIMGFTANKTPAILIARIGNDHRVPEKPHGYSLVNMKTGKKIWQKKLPGGAFFYNSSWNSKYVVWYNRQQLYILDPQTGEKLKTIHLAKNVTLREYSPKKQKYITQIGIDLKEKNMIVTPAFYTNFLKDDYYYFMTNQTKPSRNKKSKSKNGPYYSFGRVNLKTSAVEYLEVPTDFDIKDTYLWRTSLASDTTNIRDIDVANDPRGKLSGWFRCFNANPVAVNSSLYFTLESGMTYVFDMSTKVWDEKAFISLNDMGETGTMRTLSQPLVIGNRVYHRTAKELICFQKK